MKQIGECIAELFGWGGPPEPGSLEVTVTERESDEPVAGVVVTLAGRTTGRAVTGADGVARFPSLEPGPYWVAAKEEPEFEIDARCQRLLMTLNPRGYLRRARRGASQT